MSVMMSPSVGLKCIHVTRKVSLATMNHILSRCFSEQKADNIYTIPNLLCVTRIALTPVISIAVVQHNYTPAFTLFAFAGITDFLDGQIARRFPSQRSLLGSIIDPIADKTLMGVTSMTLCFTQLLPWWLFLIIISRDILLLAGGLFLRYKSLETVSLKNMFNFTDGSLEVKPGLHGKVNMCLQLGAVTACLANPVFSLEEYSFYTPYLMLTGFSGIYSLCRYIATYKTAFNKLEKPPEWMEKK